MTILRSDRAHSTTSVLGWVEQFVKSKSIQDGEVPVVRVGEQTVLVRWNEDIKQEASVPGGSLAREHQHLGRPSK